MLIEKEKKYKENNCQSTIVYLVKLSFHRKGEMIFSVMQSPYPPKYYGIKEKIKRMRELNKTSFYVS